MPRTSTLNTLLYLLPWLLLPACLALGPGRPLNGYGQQSWQSDSGLPQNTVRAILQTRDGFLWLGTEAGLVRFDGTDFRVFDPANTPALASGFIANLSEDAAGTLWIATAEGLLARRDNSFTAFGEPQGLPSANVYAVRLAPGGGVLALTARGAARFDGRRFHLLPGTEALGFTGSASLVADGWMAGTAAVAPITGGSAIPVPEVGQIQAIAAANGALWVGGSSGLLQIEGSSRTRSPLRYTLPSEDVTALLASPAGLWVGTGKGLALLTPGGIRSEPTLAGQRIDSLFLDREGELWAATGEGIARIAAGQAEYTQHRPTLPGVLTLYEDREGSMWFGTDSAGLSVLRERPFSTLTTEDGLSASVVRSVFEDHAGTLWIGTAGGLDRSSGGRVTSFAGPLPSRAILAIAESPASRDLWLGSTAGLVRVHHNVTRTYTTADGLADDFVRSLYADPDGTLWIGTRNGLSEWRDGHFRSWSTLDGLGGDLVGAILRTRDGRLWVGTLGGLSYLEGASFRTLPSSGVTAMLEDSRGTLWVANNNAGLSRVAPTPAGPRLIALPSSSGLPGTIYGMLEDASGHLWLSSRTGIDRVRIRDLDSGHRPEITSFGTADGMRLREASGGGHPAAWRARDGSLWFATLNGAAVVSPESLRPNTVAPLAAIEQVLVDGDEVRSPRDRTIRVAPGRGRLTIAYAGLSFAAPAKVRYRTMLAGFDKQWTEAGTRRTAYYTNVPPGSYRFLVLASNNDGVWSVRPAEVRFEVRPFYYQTAWFYALLILALAGAATLVYLWRVRSVAAEYRAVLEERGRIAREIHDTLAQGYVAVSVQIDLAERLLATSSAAAAQQLRATRALVRDSLEEARSSIWNLRAHADAGTLPAQLAEDVRRASARTASALRFAVHGTYRPLSAQVEPEIRRIAQEALANAVTHARAASITVTLTYSAAQLELRVADDGIGLPANPTRRGHFGLAGMRERAARIHAILTINPSSDAKGTVVTLQVPSSE